MNKKIQIMTSIIILLIMFGIQVSYAISGQNDNNSFFTVNAEKIEQNETLRILFNLNKIEYDNFKIILNSNIDINQIHTDDNITVKEEANAVVIEIDKTKMNIGSIEMSYVVPEETEVNSQIKLSANVIIEEEIEQQDDEENTILVKQERTVLEESKNITVIEKKANESTDNTKIDDEKQEQNADANKEQNNKEENKEKNQDTDSKQQGENNKDNTNKTSDLQNNNNNSMANMEKANNNSNNNKSANISMNSTSKNTNSTLVQSNKNAETAIYNGSNNNYLKKLKVKGIDLNTNFNKENSTYFIKVTDTSNIKVTATAEDSTAKVTVTGNDNIKEGINKILIAVTAENGDTRYYRIFVNCEISD